MEVRIWVEVVVNIGTPSSLQVIIHMLKNIASSNVGAIITGVLCLLVLIGLRYINDKYKSKMKFPIPGELLVVMLYMLNPLSPTLK